MKRGYYFFSCLHFMAEKSVGQQKYGLSPPCPSVVQQEKKLPIKRDTLAKLESRSRKWTPIEGSACRTEGITFNSGISDWHHWCNCKNKCGTNWSYQWLFQLRIIRANQSAVEREIALKDLVFKVKVSK